MKRKLASIGLLTVVLVGAAIPRHAQSADPSSDGEALKSTRDTLSKWVETQKIISKEKRDWQSGEEVLEQRISLMESEIETLRGRIEQTAGSITDADLKRRDLVQQNVSLKEAAASLDATIDELEAKTLRLLGSLPGPLLERVGVLAQRIPRAPSTTELPLSERFQNVIGVLNEVNKFNGTITVTTELRELSAGTTAEVQTMYVGLGQAFYVTPDGEAAGVGLPAEEGWEWTPANNLAPRVLQAIAILKNEEVPAYVPLPVTLR